ncbi:uncharacterized protein FIBRA_04582 [Fibroporia radiculosa]|uniref:Uncharacterized protein n=1 Tax=Fibroporia radiculosa TaxID=599839 RepID=J4HWL7_9APHY|nr:uncharacterized protein FIBRA_04582 [Fibroporia radiculosa]CCM02482.1 predicted protein [Fibroporia radiculosa]
MQLFNASGLIVPTTGGMPTFLGNVSDSALLDYISMYAWPFVYELLPYIASAHSQMTPGLLNNTLYDVLSKNDAIGEVQTNAMSANVTCGFLPNATIRAVENSLVNATTTLGVIANLWTVEAVLTWLDLAPLVINTIMQLPSNWELRGSAASMNCPQGRDILFVVSTNVSDSNGAFKSSVKFPSEYPPSQINMWIWYSAHLSSDDLVLTNTHVSLSKWAAMFDTAPEWQGIGIFYVQEIFTNIFASELKSPDVVEQYLIQTFNMTPGEPLQTTLTLDQIENGLANLTASLYWAESSLLPNMRSFQLYLYENGPPNKTLFSVERGSVIAAQLAARLNLNILPISIGLAASLVLLALSISLTRGKNNKDIAIQSFGILDLAWLISEKYELREIVGRVEDPTIENLRAAGMTPITIVRRKTYEASVYMGLDSDRNDSSTIIIV